MIYWISWQDDVRRLFWIMRLNIFAVSLLTREAFVTLTVVLTYVTNSDTHIIIILALFDLKLTFWSKLVTSAKRICRNYHGELHKTHNTHTHTHANTQCHTELRVGV